MDRRFDIPYPVSWTAHSQSSSHLTPCCGWLWSRELVHVDVWYCHSETTYKISTWFLLINHTKSYYLCISIHVKMMFISIYCIKMQYYKIDYKRMVKYLLQLYEHMISVVKIAKLGSQFLFVLTVFGNEIRGWLVSISCSSSWSAVGRVSELVCRFKACFAWPGRLCGALCVLVTGFLSLMLFRVLTSLLN